MLYVIYLRIIYRDSTQNVSKRAVRPITNSDYREHTAPIFAKLGILDILQVDALQIAKYKFYYHNQLLPPMFLSSFPENRQVHSYDTRKANCY